MKNQIKHIAKTIGLYFTYDSWKMAKDTQAKQAREQDVSNKLNEVSNSYKDLVNSSLNKEAKVETFFSNINKTKIEKECLENKAEFLSSKLSNPSLNLEEKSKILEAIRENNEKKHNLAEDIISQAQSFKENYNENSLSTIFDYLLEMYKNYLTTLNVDQLACLTNIVGLIWVISILNGILFTYYGNKIINSFNLEKKWPKLSSIIKLRCKVSEKVLQLEILYLYLVISLVLIIDIVMFFTS